MPMTKEAAIAKIKTIDCHASYKTRGEALLKNPDILNQGWFGVCGMTSIVYTFLKYDPESFAKLFETVLAGAGFPAETGTVTPPGNLLQTLEAQWQRKFATKQSLGAQYVTTPAADAKLDFVLSRALPELLGEVEGAGAIVEMQHTFSREWENWNPAQGDLALTEECQDGLVTIFGRAAEVKQIQHLNMNFPRAVEQINATFAKKGPFVYAAVNGTEELLDQKFVVNSPKKRAPVTTARPQGRRTGKEFVHWIVITDRITKTGTTYKLPVWTWARKYTVEIDEGVARDYLYAFIHGALGR